MTAASAGSVPQILPLHGACMRVGLEGRGLDSADLKWIFCEGE
jgi:hypothetical protein